MISGDDGRVMKNDGLHVERKQDLLLSFLNDSVRFHSDLGSKAFRWGDAERAKHYTSNFLIRASIKKRILNFSIR